MTGVNDGLSSASGTQASVIGVGSIGDDLGGYVVGGSGADGTNDFRLMYEFRFLHESDE